MLLLISGALLRYHFFFNTFKGFSCVILSMAFLQYSIIPANDGSLWNTIPTVLSSWWSLCSSCSSNGNQSLLHLQMSKSSMNRPCFLNNGLTFLSGYTTTRCCFSSNTCCKSLSLMIFFSSSSVWMVAKRFENVFCRLQLRWTWKLIQLTHLETRIRGSWKSWKNLMDLQCL